MTSWWLDLTHALTRFSHLFLNRFSYRRGEAYLLIWGSFGKFLSGVQNMATRLSGNGRKKGYFLFFRDVRALTQITYKATALTVSLI